MEVMNHHPPGVRYEAAMVKFLKDSHGFLGKV